MNPHLILSAAKAAYENREVAAKLLTKIKDWQQSAPEDADKPEAAMPLEDRVKKLEKDAARKNRLYEEQSELIAGLAENVAALSVTTQNLVARMKVLMRLMVVALVLSVAAVIISLI